jgi:hypothetical protein
MKKIEINIKLFYYLHLKLMNENEINTYCSGFILKSIKDISKKEFVELCYNLQYKFNIYYNTNEYSFSPECITEGGIVFNNFNNETKYKTMRMYFTNEKDGTRIKNLYGFINNDIKEEWKNDIKEEWKNDENILINNNVYIGTYLKSFRDAPKYTSDELKIFIECFENIGLYIEKLPTKKELKRLKNYSYYLNLFNINV